MRNRSLALLFTLAVPLPLAAQQPLDSIPGPPRPSVRWYHAAAALGAVSGASLLDASLRDELQGHRTAGKDDVATFSGGWGSPRSTRWRGSERSRRG